MKRLMIIAFAVMAFAMSMYAEETEGIKIGKTNWKLDGEIRFMYTDQTDPGEMYGEGTNYYKDAGSINRMYQRYRLGITGEFNEQLSAHYMLQVGDEQWGNRNYNEREINIKTLYAYLKYSPEFLPGMTFTAGLQGYDDIFQYSVWSDEGVGIIANYKSDSFNINAGFLTIRDDDVDTDVDPYAGEGYLSSSDTLFITDMHYKGFIDGLECKGGFYYEKWTTIDPVPMGDINYHVAYYGLGFDYSVMESIMVGGHYVARGGSGEYYNDDDSLQEWNLDGYFLFGYASYAQDKFSFKANFGYTPFAMEWGEEPSVTSWSGAFAWADSAGGGFYFARGNQWVSAYGLEYAGRGDVCDRLALLDGYGYWPGLMVISFNVAYDFVYANYGILQHTYDDETTFVDVDKSIGSELDFGVKTHIMDGLEFRAVYAMFFTGDFWKFNDDEAEVENAHELSMQLLYSF